MNTLDEKPSVQSEDVEDWMHKDNIQSDGVTFFQMVFYPTPEMPVDQLARFLATRLYEWNSLATDNPDTYEPITSPLQTAILPSPDENSQISNCLMLQGVSYGSSLQLNTPEGFKKWLLSKYAELPENAAADDRSTLTVALTLQLFGIEKRGILDRHRHLSVIRVEK